VDRLSVVGVAPFAGDTLASIRRARVVLDVGSVVRHLTRGGRIVVREVLLERPTLRLRVLADGRANWDVARSRGGVADSGRAVGVTLRALRITGGALALDDRRSRLAASLSGLDVTLGGDFARDRFTLETRTRADSVSVHFAGVPYLSRARVELVADVDADLRAGRFTLARDTLRVNALALAVDGSVTTGTPDLGLDLTFATPSTAFRDILSLVPAIYARDFARLRTEGRMSVSGRVRGRYGPRAFPSLALRARVANGSFRYPSLPLPARDVSMDLAVTNPGGHVDSTVVALERLHAVIGGRPLDARLVMRTPVSDPDVDLRLTGALDLADVARTVKLDGVRDLAGVVAADVAMRARLSDVDAGHYHRVAARGTVDAGRVTLRSPSGPQPIAVDTAALRFTPRTAELTALVARAGDSDVRATGSLDNLLAFALRDAELRGRATVHSRHLDLNRWRSGESSEVVPVPPNVDFTLDASADRVLHGPLTAANVRGGLRVKDRRATLHDLRMEMLGGTFVANGSYETTVADRPTFDVALRLDGVDIPTAAALGTVQRLAPLARWARGSVSGTLAMKGALDRQMTPLFATLGGEGAIETGPLALQGVPSLARLAEALSLDGLRAPAVAPLRAAFAFAGGRVTVRPFTARLAGMDVGVAGSHGFDQSLRYDLTLAVPRALLGGAAGAAVTRLVGQAGRAGLDVSAADTVRIAARVTGTVTSPAVRVSFAGTGASAREAVQTAARREAEARAAEVKRAADSTLDEARRRAGAQAERLVAEAERQAAAIRAEARDLAATVLREGNARADSLLARATNPAARVAAKLATDRARRAASEHADRVVREADVRADSLVARARRQAAALVPSRE
jgi:hypothetical protein